MPSIYEVLTGTHHILTVKPPETPLQRGFGDINSRSECFFDSLIPGDLCTLKPSIYRVSGFSLFKMGIKAFKRHSKKHSNDPDLLILPHRVLNCCRFLLRTPVIKIVKSACRCDISMPKLRHNKTVIHLSINKSRCICLACFVKGSRCNAYYLAYTIKPLRECL